MEEVDNCLDDIKHDFNNIIDSIIQEKIKAIKIALQGEIQLYLKNLDYREITGNVYSELRKFINTEIGNQIRVYTTEAPENKTAYNKLFKEIFDEELKKQFKSDISKFIREEIQQSIKSLIEEKFKSI